MTRVEPALYQELPQEIQKLLDTQARVWGAPLTNHLLYARIPSLSRGVRGMWRAIDEAGLIEPPLQALVNRRVAIWNGCEF